MGNWSFKQRLLIYISLYAVWACGLFVFTGGTQGFNAWLRGFQHWDTHWYHQIATVGYAPDNFKALAFPPIYGYLLTRLSWLFGISYSVTCFMFNTVAYLVALTLLTEVLARLFKMRSHVMLFMLALTTPTGYLIFSGYSDLLFMAMYWGLLFLALFYPYDKRSLIAQAAIFLLLPWVRIAGYSQLSWLVLRRYVALVLLIPLAGWLALNYSLSGDMLHFYHVQARFSLPGCCSILDGARELIRSLLRSSITNIKINTLSFVYLPAFYLVTITAAAGWFAYKREWLLAVSSMSLMAISHFSSFWRSNVRYEMIIIPCIFVPLMYLAERKPKFAPFAWGVAGLVGLAQLWLQQLYANEFRHGHWGF